MAELLRWRMRLWHVGDCSLLADPIVPVAKSASDVTTFFFPHSELSAAFAWYEPARHHHKVHFHGQEGDQQAAQTEGEEERVDIEYWEEPRRWIKRRMLFKKKIII